MVTDQQKKHSNNLLHLEQKVTRSKRNEQTDSENGQANTTTITTMKNKIRKQFNFNKTIKSIKKNTTEKGEDQFFV